MLSAMKNAALFLLFFLLSAVRSFAQIQLEHSYPAGRVWRTQLDVSGETYARKSPFSCDVMLYDAGHQEKIILPVAAASDCGNYVFSEKIMDGDAGVELLCGWLDDQHPLATGSICRDDNGAEWNFNSSAFQLSRGAGLSTKLLTGATVRALPGLQTEHVYQSSTQWRLERQMFPLDGEQYIAYNSHHFEGFHFYNAQHEAVKTVNLAQYPGFEYLTHISQQYFHPDAQLEFFGARWTGAPDANGNPQRTEVVQEDGTVLFSMASDGYILSQLPGLPDRLLVSGYGSPQQRQTTVVDPASLAVLHTFPGNVLRMALPDGEEIYTEHQIGSKVLIYNSQYEMIQSVPLPGAYALSITRGQFSKGKKFEFCYNVKGASLPNWVRCSDEDGKVLYEFPGATQVRIDRQQGLADRLFVPYGTAPDSTQVYKFVPSTSVGAAPQPAFATAMPSPFEHTLLVRFAETGDYQLSLLNSVGQLALKQTVQQADAASLPVAALPAGVYELLVESARGRQVLRVVKAR